MKELMNLEKKKKKTESIIDLTKSLSDKMQKQFVKQLNILQVERDRSSTLQEFVQQQEKLNDRVDKYNKQILSSQTLLTSLLNTLKAIVRRPVVE
jgi:hypothetical protein